MQIFTGDGSAYGISNMKINKDSGTVTIGKPIQISQDLTFAKGNLITTSTNLLTIAHLATVTGASDSSFTEGPVKKIGSSSFVFLSEKTQSTGQLR